MSLKFQLQAIGIIRSPFPEKFGIPRQPGLAPSAIGEIQLFPEFCLQGVLDGLEASSHLWLSFWFHEQSESWSPKVRPPRLGGNKKLGVFATRSPRRPNPLGLSVVRLLSVDQHSFSLRVGGVDLLDGTPIIDIKPYIPYTDKVLDAQQSFAIDAPALLAVHFEDEALEQLQSRPELKNLISEVLSQDPRPAYHQEEKVYGTTLQEWNVKWSVIEGLVRVSHIEAAD